MLCQSRTPWFYGFQILAATTTCLGLIFTIVFHVGTKESPTSCNDEPMTPYAKITSDSIPSNKTNEKTPGFYKQDCIGDQESANNNTCTSSLVKDNAKVYSDDLGSSGKQTVTPTKRSWFQWLKTPQFYQVKYITISSHGILNYQKPTHFFNSLFNWHTKIKAPHQ